MIHMFSIWLSSCIILSVNTILATNLRCNEDINGSFQLIENCRACVIFIAPATLPTMTTTMATTITTTTITTRTTTTTKKTTTMLSRNMFATNVEPSIEELFLFDEKKRRRRRRQQQQQQQQRNVDTVIHQQCARELDGPLYGYDQTHCYCNSNQCNSNIQRCIYEVTSKRHFACYHGTNSSQSLLEIRYKCRSCRIRTEFNSIYHYECLTFGEREQNNNTHCTCQRPMCNQDVSTCQRLQQSPTHSRTHLLHAYFFNLTTLSITTTSKTTTTRRTSTTPFTTITTTTITSTTTSSSSTIPLTTTIPITTTTATSTITSTLITKLMTILTETDEEISTENTTIIELTTLNDTTTTSVMKLKQLKPVYIQIKNSGNYFSSSSILTFILLLFIYSM